MLHGAFLSGRHKLGDAEADECDAYESHAKVDQERRHPAIDKHVHKDGEWHGCHVHRVNTEKTEREKNKGKAKGKVKKRHC